MNLTPKSALFFFLVFVSLNTRTSSYETVQKERTFAMIKPDGMRGNYTERIKNALQESGFTTLQEMAVQLDKNQAVSFYAEHSSKSFFSSLVEYMTSGPVLVMVLEKENAISDWRELIGPTDARKAKVTHPSSIRAMCGVDLQRNCVHGSDSPQSAEREIAFFFKEMASGRAVSKHDEL